MRGSAGVRENKTEHPSRSTTWYHPGGTSSTVKWSLETARKMISSIHIEGYRGFERFEMSGLGRINLLVGTNNSGKTSVLEALHLLTSRGDPATLWQLLWRRGERLLGDRSTRNQPDLDISHLFTGHDAHIGASFALSARNETPERILKFTISEMTAKQQSDLLGVRETSTPLPSRLVLEIKGHPPAPVAMLPLTRACGLSSEVLEAPPRRGRRRASEEGPSQFITSESLDSDDLVALWDKVTLTPNENLVLQALGFLDPDIERIAAQSAQGGYYAYRGGFILKRRGHDHPIPIGSMGDGMWRMLAMAIAITQCKGGVMLVDEIDTGLHYTVMSGMWRLIFGAAKELDVQVFATTHSFDCIQSLANVCMSENAASDTVTLQRIEMGRPRAIPYTENEIRVASERNIEVR